VLRLPLPNANKDDLDLATRDGDLLLRVGPYRRAMVLPDSLRRREITGASLDGGVLAVTFS
jgi:HSP20 family molecular chaperone IbpA